MRLNERHEGTIESTLQDVLGLLSRWSLELAIGSVAGIVFLGTELGSLLLTGSLVPGARILEGILWVAGPGDTLFALAAQGIAELGSNHRELYPEEYDFARPVFGRTLAPPPGILLTDTIGPNTRPFTFPSNTGKTTLNMGSPGYTDPRAFDTNLGIGVFGQTYIHELTHAWQIKYSPTDTIFLAEAFAARVCEAVGGDPYAVQPGQPFSDYSLEQQAMLVEAWFAKHSQDLDGIAATADPRFQYIAQNIRLGLI